MMFRLTLERLRDSMTLRLTQNESRYQVLAVDGIEGPEIDMSTYEIATTDGSKVSNIRMPEREITITLVFRGNVERNRMALYQLCRVRSIIRLHFETNGGAKYIDGYLRVNDGNRFDDPTFTQDVTFICPDPYFKAEQPITADMSREYAAFVFPSIMGGFAMSAGHGRPTGVFSALRTATINSVSENETGIVITMRFKVDTWRVVIMNADTGERFDIKTPAYYTSGHTGEKFLAGDTVVVNTIDGQKSVSWTHTYTTKDAIAWVSDDSEFFQLQAGDNSFSYVVNDEPTLIGVEMDFDFTPVYFAL